MTYSANFNHIQGHQYQWQFDSELPAFTTDLMTRLRTL